MAKTRIFLSDDGKTIKIRREEDDTRKYAMFAFLGWREVIEGEPLPKACYIEITEDGDIE